jgi:hypothetical protein
MKKLYVLGGGTISHVRNHLALCAPAFGSTARRLFDLCYDKFRDAKCYLNLTKMADFTSDIITNDDIENRVNELVADFDTKVIIFNVALCDWNGDMAIRTDLDEKYVKSGKYAERLRTSEGYKVMMLKPAEKIIKKIRENRTDIFVIGFKTTCGASEQEQFRAGLELLTMSNINLVLANDTRTRANMILVGGETGYHMTKSRDEALIKIVDITHDKIKEHEQTT